MGIDKEKELSIEAADLRREAEVRLQLKTNKRLQPRTDEEVQRLLQEFEIHEIELEMQNAELSLAQAELEKTLERYSDLYEFAPVGYLNLERNGAIRAVNLRGATLLGVERSSLIGRRFENFILEADRPVLTSYLSTIFTSKRKETCELTLLNQGAGPLIVQIEQIEALVDVLYPECRLAMIDITMRRRAEDALRDSEERMYRLAEMAVDAIIMMDECKSVTFCNTAAEKVFGFSAAEIIGRNFYQLCIPKRQLSPKKPGFDQFREEGTGPLIDRKTEVTARRKDGTEFPLEISLSSVKFQGKWHAIGIMRDVTEHNRLDLEIKDAREYAENIVETVREPLVVLNSELKILTANHSFYETFEVTAEETIDNFIYDVGNRQWDIPRLRVLIEKILPQDTVINGYEVEHDFPGIGRKTILLNARQIFREEIGSQIILLAMEDITDRKLAEERVKEISRQQQAILDNIPNAAWLKDKEGRYVAANGPYSKDLGMEPMDLVGKNDFDIFPPDLAEKYEKEINEVIRTGKRTSFDETRVDSKGKTLHLEKVKTPIFNDAGEAIGVIGIIYDVTASKEIEVTLRHESTHDILTGLYNRAFFDTELERLSRGRLFPLSIVMADINDLKRVNDTLGHSEGDKMIGLAARIMLEAFRSEDIVARIGGDEFAVLLPKTDRKVAEEAVERILRSPEVVNGEVTIAFGIACAEDEDHIAEALKASDERMYQDKSNRKKLQVGGSGESS
ncbi:diguanylate cyclase with PAS/PAC sensor [Desulfuromonas soudanensis]|uniref:Diguanylate cyclase with PAS/PAC sensor n=1 Tax=Desulfuromonas soudanensis TaxID=1603606 RepID=A0A0M4DHM6_9BACT|nr:PAS domain S-box protein [Desulfuromonas soudanensis]ALC16587.1 diguanylate cyclase with PAS/PAC sensor [Desulfuromonas soudanensis]